METTPVRLDDLIDYVRNRHPGGTALDHLSTAVLVSEHLGDLADHLIGHFVDQARRAGASWTGIGDSMGVSKQAVQKRFVASKAERLLSDSSLDRFTDRAKRVLLKAQQAARTAGHPHIGSEHLVLGLLDEPGGLAAKAIVACGGRLDDVRQKVFEILGPAQEDVPEHIPFTPGAKKVRDLTLREALRLGHDYIGTEHVLLGLLDADDEPGARVLLELGVTKPDVERWVITTLGGIRHVRGA